MASTFCTNKRTAATCYCFCCMHRVCEQTNHSHRLSHSPASVTVLEYLTAAADAASGFTRSLMLSVDAEAIAAPATRIKFRLLVGRGSSLLLLSRPPLFFLLLLLFLVFLLLILFLLLLLLMLLSDIRVRGQSLCCSLLAEEAEGNDPDGAATAAAFVCFVAGTHTYTHRNTSRGEVQTTTPQHGGTSSHERLH